MAITILTSWNEEILVTNDKLEAVYLSHNDSAGRAVFCEPEIDELRARAPSEDMLRAVCAAKRAMRAWIVPGIEDLELGASIDIAVGHCKQLAEEKRKESERHAAIQQSREQRRRRFARPSA